MVKFWLLLIPVSKTTVWLKADAIFFVCLFLLYVLFPFLCQGNKGIYLNLYCFRIYKRELYHLSKLNKMLV